MPDELSRTHWVNGRALWGIHALWAIVLEAWGQEHKGPSGSGEPWPGIEFDKLAHFIHLVWLTLYNRNIVSFRSAYNSADGVHGPGPALPRRAVFKRVVPALEVLDHIQQELTGNPDVHLFALAKRGKSYKVRAGRERTFTGTQLGDLLPPAWQQRDLELVRQIRDVVLVLTQEEIRALGTHQSAEGTIKALEYNVYIHLFRRFMREIARIEEAGKQGTPEETDLPSLESVIDEIGRKSRRNEPAYTSALEKLRQFAASGNEVAQAALDDVFSEPGEIWTSEVRRWEPFGEIMSALRSYIKALQNAILPPLLPSATEKSHELSYKLDREEQDGRAAVGEIEQCLNVRLPALPSARSDEYSWVTLRAAVVDIFDHLPGQTEYRDWYEDYIRRRAWRT